MQMFSNRMRSVFLGFFAIALITVLAISCIPQQKAGSNNFVIFITDGLRPSAVNPQDTPTLSEIQQQGVNFVNSHSLFPTFTTANASAIATGHYLGDTGDFSNTINVGFFTKSANNSPVPAQIRKALKDLGLEENTNIFVAADHGFSTISKQSKTSYAATLSYPDVPKGFLPPGFLAIDLAHELKLPLTDPDKKNTTVIPTKGEFSKNGLINKDPKKLDVVVAANGGSDLIYLPNPDNNDEASL
jgi:arylsulfatase A-like enzyme